MRGFVLLMANQDERHRLVSGFLLKQYNHAFLKNSKFRIGSGKLSNWIQLSRINRDLLALLIQARADDQPYSYSELQELANISRNTVKNSVRIAAEWDIAEVSYDSSKAQIMATGSVMTQYFDWVAAAIDDMNQDEKSALANLLND